METEAIEIVDLTGEEPFSPIRAKHTQFNVEDGRSNLGRGLRMQGSDEATALQSSAPGNGHAKILLPSCAVGPSSSNLTSTGEEINQAPTATADTETILAEYACSMAREEGARQAQLSRLSCSTMSIKRPYESADAFGPSAKAARVDHDCSQMVRGRVSRRGAQTSSTIGEQSRTDGRETFRSTQPTPAKLLQPAPPPQGQSTYPATSVQPSKGAMPWWDCQVAYRAITLLAGQRPDGGPLNWIAWYAGKALQDESLLDVLHCIAMQTASPFQLAKYRRMGQEGSSRVLSSSAEQIARDLLRDCPAAQAALEVVPGVLCSTPLNAQQNALIPHPVQTASAEQPRSVATPQRLNTSLIHGAMKKTMLWKCTEDTGFMQHLLQAATKMVEFEESILVLSQAAKYSPKAEFTACTFVEQQQQAYGRIFQRALLAGRQKSYVPRPSAVSLSGLQNLAERALCSRQLQIPAAIAQALALEAAVDGLCEELLSVIANGVANAASVSAFELAIQHIYQSCDLSESIDSVVREDLAAHKAGDTATAAAKTVNRSAAGWRTSESVDEEWTSKLRVLAMRLRIVQHDPSLPCLDPTVKRMAEQMKRDAVFAKAIEHISGESGHTVPDQNQLLVVKRFVVSGQNQKPRQDSDSFALPEDESPKKLLPGQWPLPITPAYQRYLQQSGHEPRSQITVARSERRPRKYSAHPDSETCPWNSRNEVPYPLSLLPKRTWDVLHHDQTEDAVCSCCRRPISLSPYQKKLFLVAERLACPAGMFGIKAREKDEQALWAVNYQLGIEEPVDVSSQETVFGGRYSHRNQWYPFKNKEEAQMIMLVIERAHVLTDTSWAAWQIATEQQLQEGNHSRMSADKGPCISTGSRETLKERSSNILQTPPSSSPEAKTSMIGLAKPSTAPVTRFTISLVDFYKLLDKIERTSPMATKYLEAYADRLSCESCSKCWLEENVRKEALDVDASDEDA